MVELILMGDDTQLLQQPKLIDQHPMLHNHPIHKSGKNDPLHLDRPASRRVPQERALMRAAHRPMCCNLIALSDFILDFTLKIGEGSAKHGNQPF